MKLTLKGLQSGFKNSDVEETRIGHISIVKDRNYDLLVKVGHAIISAFLEKGVFTKKDLSHISFDRQKEMWVPDQYHMTVIRASKNPIDATKLIEEYGDAKLGEM